MEQTVLQWGWRWSHAYPMDALLTPSERLQVLQQNVQSLRRLIEWEFLHLIFWPPEGLGEHKVDFIIVGGVSAVLHGAPVHDLRSWFASTLASPENIERLSGWPKRTCGILPGAWRKENWAESSISLASSGTSFLWPDSDPWPPWNHRQRRTELYWSFTAYKRNACHRDDPSRTWSGYSY